MENVRLDNKEALNGYITPVGFLMQSLDLTAQFMIGIDNLSHRYEL